jgi:hypothetical protein
LKNISKVKNSIKIRCNAGVTTTNLIGYLPGYGEVWFIPEGFSNIFSLENVIKKHEITFDSSSDDAILVHKKDSTILRFKN